MKSYSLGMRNRRSVYIALAATAIGSVNIVAFTAIVTVAITIAVRAGAVVVALREKLF